LSAQRPDPTEQVADLPMVRDRRDETAEALQEPADAHEMLQALHQKRDEKKPTDD